MSKAIYFYFPSNLSELEIKVSAFQDDFEDFLTETFTENELESFESQLDSLAAVFVQPIFNELSFDDLSPQEDLVEEQRLFFARCKSSICIENLPDLECNPFQVSYILRLLDLFEEILIDPGGVRELIFKHDFYREINAYKSVDAMISSPFEKPVGALSRPVFPIDFLVMDVYIEINRLRSQDRIEMLDAQISSLPEKSKVILEIMLRKALSADMILSESKLIPKDFGDFLEKIKFFLKKI